jgi:hypothetical protein
MPITLFDQHGRAYAFSDDDVHFFSYADGRPLAYLDGASVYNFSGNHVGWFVDGWVMDNVGQCAYFSDDAAGGPLRPQRSLKPLKPLKSLLPLKSLRSLKPLKPLASSGWCPVPPF